MTINKFNYEVYALEYLEGALSPEMSEEMERFLQINPAIESELSGMMELVIFEPDESVVYEYKADLYKGKEEEKVVYLNKNWRRFLMMAASIALLIFTYFLGYKTGHKNIELPVAKVEKSKKIIESKISSPIIELKSTKNIATNELHPKKEQLKSIVKIDENIIYQSPSKIASNSKNIISNPIIPFLEKASNHPTEIIAQQKSKTIQLIDKELIVEGLGEGETRFMPILPLPTSSLSYLKSTNDTLNNLSKILQQNLNIDKKLLATNQKKKRGFRDLLGKFPINNLKEALIPTYYRGDSAGE